jgi:hypothetical protein
MTRLTHDDLDCPADTVDAALDSFDRFERIKDKKQARRHKIALAQNVEELPDMESYY